MKQRTYGRPEWMPKYLPDTMVEVDGKMVRYGDLDEKFEWLEMTSYQDIHPIFVIGMHYGDTE